MNYKSTLVNLYYLLMLADGKINERELILGRKMMEAENINEAEFNQELENLQSITDHSTTLKQVVTEIKKLELKWQIRCIAWMCVIANADGFMAKDEWVLIYKIYHTELKLSLDEIMKTQKELNQIIHGRAFTSLGVRMTD
ncbi:MAG: TerB family tellurite resistance protein [Chryseotalea sp.]